MPCGHDGPSPRADTREVVYRLAPTPHVRLPHVGYGAGVVHAPKIADMSKDNQSTKVIILASLI
jgi:hypothetical protein